MKNEASQLLTNIFLLKNLNLSYKNLFFLLLVRGFFIADILQFASLRQNFYG